MEPGAPASQNVTLLVVDDEPAILDLICRVCEGEGFRCLRASDGQAALKVFEEHRDEITAMVTDVNMPNMDGLALIQAVRRIAPKVKIVLSSGSLGEAEHRIATEFGVNAFLPKPYTTSQILPCIRSAIGPGRR